MKAKSPKPVPPRWATRLLQWYCATELLEEVQGDLEEEFNYQVQNAGVKRARMDYIYNIIGFIKPFAIKRKISQTSISFLNMNMLSHYVTVAMRNLIRHKAFSAINSIGLALGMTCFLMIFLWVNDENRVDNFHAHENSLYHVYQTFYSNEQVTASYGTPDKLAAEMKRSIPEVKYAASYASGYELPWGHPETFQINEKVHKFEGSRASEDFFKMFSYTVIAGNAETALTGTSSLAISRKMAELFFERADEALGKSIRFENRKDFVITAVFENVPVYSSLKFDYLINWEAYMNREADRASWNTRTFIQLRENADVANVEAATKHFWDTHIDKNAGYKATLGLQRFGDQYLHANFVNGKPDGGRIEYVRIFSGVAIFILIIACINFMNLATARSVKRAKEVGVRKVVGSSRSHLIGQFFGESLLLSFIGLLLSLVLIELLLPSFNSFTGKQIASPITEITSCIILIGLMIVTGFISGSYPALFLSSLKPVRVLKGVVRFTNAAIWFRKSLAIFQFSLSIILLIATLVVSRQTSYIQTTHLGYDRENLIYIRIEGELIGKYSLFKEAASKMPGIGQVDRSSEAPHAMGFMVADAIDWEGKIKDNTVGYNSLHATQIENGQGQKNASVGFYPTSVGYDFLKLMNLKIVEGRDFSRDHSTDSTAFMINETAVKQMGLRDPIGKWISAWDKKGHIIAVLKDYHMHSLHEPIKPLIVDVKEDLNFGVIVVRLEPGKTKEGLGSLNKIYKDINPNYPFTYQFLDHEYDKLYRNERVITKLSNAFALLAIVISCLGLLGLVMFSAEQRIKEIGIRKVLGASVTNIVSLLSIDFLKLVVISFLISAPIAAYFMNEWLKQFAFKEELTWWIFALAGVTALFIAFLTICVQAIRSATADPIDSLQTE